MSEEPRWLCPAERAAWLTIGRLTSRLPGALDAQLQRDAGLSFIEYMVLAMLSEQPDRTLRMSELARLTDASLSRLSHLARRMEAQGFLRRAQDAVDGRYTNAILTDTGHAKVVASAPGHVARVRELVIDALSADQLAQLRVLNEQILTTVDPGSACSEAEPASGVSPRP